MGRCPPAAPPSPFSRFYKLHERKCEPIVMTVPRKVRPPRSPLKQTGHSGVTRLRPVNGMWPSVGTVSGLDRRQHVGLCCTGDKLG